MWCGKGVYVCFLVCDLGYVLGMEGYIIELCCIEVGFFLEEEFIKLDELEEMVYKGVVLEVLFLVQIVLDDILVLVVIDDEIF